MFVLCSFLAIGLAVAVPTDEAAASTIRARVLNVPPSHVTNQANSKAHPYASHSPRLAHYSKYSQHHFNAARVFPGVKPVREHGLLGVYASGDLWLPPTPAVRISSVEKALDNGGGFLLQVSDSLTLDRTPPDGRSAKCQAVGYDLGSLPDATVIITFYNEPLSTLLRSVHSVLNHSPSELIREVILLDDHSSMYGGAPYTSGSGKQKVYAEPHLLDDAVAYLPKTRLIRLPKRSGIVKARLAAAKVAKGQVLVILDSHIEVNVGWLEPLLHHITMNRRSIVMPQIASIDSERFSFSTTDGIGCKLSWSWGMTEKSSAPGYLKDVHPIASPAMAGGIFAVDKEWFWHLGGYDEEMDGWGAENLEMSFRAWMCGGRVDCTPCSIVYHIFRKKGLGYDHSVDTVTRNRLRVARIWLDKHFPISELFLNSASQIEAGSTLRDADGKINIGSTDQMMALKRNLQCKDFSWFLTHVDNTNPISSVEDIVFAGEISSEGAPHMCLDTMQHVEPGEPFGLFPCHHSLGTQGFVVLRHDRLIHSMTAERLCLGDQTHLTRCGPQIDEDITSPLPRLLPPPSSLPTTFLGTGLSLESNGTIRSHASSQKCLTLLHDQESRQASGIAVLPCLGTPDQKWTFKNELKKLDQQRNSPHQQYIVISA